MDPSVLLLDEPFSAIDISLRQSLRLLFQEVVADRRAPTLLVTHDLDDVRYLADRVGVLIDGELRQLGPTAEVFTANAAPLLYDQNDAEITLESYLRSAA